MGDHDAPASWLTRWREMEPVRLYLWSVATAVIVAAVAVGILTAELAVAITGVASAVLMIGGAAAARHDAYAPATVTHLLDSQHATSYAHGVEDALTRTPDELAEELAATEKQLEERPDTVLMRAQGPGTIPRERLRACPFMDEHGHRCRLPEHPRRIDHQVEEPGQQE